MTLADSSSSVPLPQLRQGIEQFNQGQYYACHDTLEAIWMEAAPTEKPFYQGILQFAVGLHHLGNHNWRGAVILLGEGMNRLQPFEPAYRGVDVTAVVDCGLAWLQALQTTGPEQVEVMAAVLQAHTQPPATDITVTHTVRATQPGAADVQTDQMPPLRIDWIAD